MTTQRAHMYTTCSPTSPPTNLMQYAPASAPTVPTAPPWTIEPVTPASLKGTADFINASRRELFPSLGHDALLDDPNVLETSHVLIARNTEGRIVAAVAYVPFDYRFPHLPPPIGNASTPPSTANSSSSSLNMSVPSFDHSCKIVEVVRLFVLHEFRRHGLAASLFQSLQEHALASGVQCMYLHTHPFLPGAIRFWEKQGFEIINVDQEDKVWLTHHFSKTLASPDRTVP